MVHSDFAIAGNTVARETSWGFVLNEPQSTPVAGNKYYSINDIHKDGWENQVQLASSLSNVCNDKFTGKRNLLVCPRNLSEEMKNGLVELTQFYIERENIADGESRLLILSSSEHFMSDETLKEIIFTGVETLSHHAQKASELLYNDTAGFKRNSQANYTRLRVQGPNCINNDSPVHSDGGQNQGIRYSGGMTDEFHDDDVSQTKERSDMGIAKDNARILRLEHGDIWAHRSNPMFSPASMMGKVLRTRSSRWHRKSDSDQAGMVLTMQ